MPNQRRFRNTLGKVGLSKPVTGTFEIFQPVEIPSMGRRQCGHQPLISCPAHHGNGLRIQNVQLGKFWRRPRILKLRISTSPLTSTVKGNSSLGNWSKYLQKRAMKISGESHSTKSQKLQYKHQSMHVAKWIRAW